MLGRQKAVGFIIDGSHPFRFAILLRFMLLLAPALQGSYAQAQYNVPPGFSVVPFTTQGLNRPASVVVAPLTFGVFGGDLFVANRNTFNGSEIDYISRISTSGSDQGASYRFADVGTSDPLAMTFDPAGKTLLVATNSTNPGDGAGKVLQIDAQGNVAVYCNKAGSSPSGGLAFDTTGDYGYYLYNGWTAYDGIGRITGPGVSATRFANFGVLDGGPLQILFGPGGVWDTGMYVSVQSLPDTWNIMLPGIYRVSTSGQVAALVTNSTSALFGQPLGFAFGPGGSFGTDMYVSDQENGTILDVTPTGSVSVFASGFNDPGGLAFADANILYVVEVATNRIVQISAVPSISLAVPLSVLGGTTTTGTLTLLNIPPGDAIITLTSSSSAASVPASVTIPAGQTSASFTITTTAVASPVAGTVTADYNGQTVSANLTVLPIGVASLTISPTTVVGGFDTATATLTLQAPAAPGPITVNLTSSDKSAIVPASVKFAKRQQVKKFIIKTAFVNQDTPVTITASANGTNASAPLTVSANTATRLKISFTPPVTPPNTGYPRGTAITITVTLTDSSGHPLANEPVQVILDIQSTGQKSTFLSGTTNANGQVSGPYTVPTDTSQFNIYVMPSFSGSKPYRKSNASRRIPIG